MMRHCAGWQIGSGKISFPSFGCGVGWLRGRPLQGSSPNDRKDYPDFYRHKRACVHRRSTRSAASAGSPSGARIPRRAEGPAKRFFRHDGIYRSDEVQKLLKDWGRSAASRWSAPSPAKERDGRSAPYPSSAMSSGRLFLDRVARQQSPSPLHRQAQTNTDSANDLAKPDISTLPASGHFYFALTHPFFPCGGKVVMSSLAK